MSSQRFEALQKVVNRQIPQYGGAQEHFSEFFGENVFGLDKLKLALSSEAWENLEAAVIRGEKISRETADAVAAAMKTWAMGKGATHYTHWFHPLRGTTAEKHDSFFELAGTQPVERFRASALVQQEPDASSFPSGGIRTTFEARGYSAWDPSSPAFIYEVAGAKTLCIPTIFVSYTGDALDHKAPMLKALLAIDKAATKVAQWFDKDVTRVTASLGAEQEYFLIDKALFQARPDLVMLGKTVFGHSPARGQQLHDHYFGSIPRRVTAFMLDFEMECIRLGIPVRTRHNEVAPAQFEVAPQFEEANLASDHNMLLMDVMERMADRHDFRVLFHEKPFAGVNGSGKHNNWALSTNTGRNLLAPAKKPKDNLQFLTFFVNTVAAVHRWADLLRVSIASANNDYRLGANEAPPAIISVFVGSQMHKVLTELEKNANLQFDKGDNLYLKLGINKIPEIILDNTDRNRTSPFAFTGNKFEFRAVGSTANCARPMTVLNTIMAQQLEDFYNEVEKLTEKGKKREVAILEVLRKLIKQSKPIIFEGDNYSEEWVKEAKKRGLNNFRTTPEALRVLENKKLTEVFVKQGVYTFKELEARYAIMCDEYVMKVQIESRVMGDLAQNHIIPAAIKYQNELLKNLEMKKQLGMKDETVTSLVKEISERIAKIRTLAEEMRQARKAANLLEHEADKADAYGAKVKPYFEKIRYEADKLELLIDDRDWPLPKYRELLFLR
ncbi:MAG: glutamine synthetase III [Flavobacteriales bacterium]|nr:glutamine synthetase III [Flavobacteriales bacterium]